MKLVNNTKKTINRVLLHVLFWLVSVAIFGYIFKISDKIESIDILYSFLFHISVFLGVYINLNLFVPLVLNKKRYISFVLFMLILILMVTSLNQLTFSHFSDIILPDYYFVVQFNYFETGIIVTIFLIGTTFFKLSKSWFKLQEVNHKITKIEKENIDNQLKALKAQINPHFLFNSLNVLYSLAIKNAKETPETIIKLSDILRYVIYDSNKEKVSIKSEVELINNYLSIQEHRVDKTSIINFATDIQKDIDIAPMLFLPLVENSFKHGVKGDVSNTFVNIKMKTMNKTVHFEIENNKGTSENPYQNKYSGIGLTNIKKRLNLLYPEKHTLTIKDDEYKFIVLLKINL
jgi:sensor histidine kinase YesM